jgi:3-hydroxybutyryl-CoA dehydrogenase
MAVESVGVVGAGQMGNGIAHVVALAGLEVRITDTNPEALAAAKVVVARNLDRQVSRGQVSPEDREATLSRIHMTAALSELGPLDLVIEAATERESVKSSIFESLLPISPRTRS